MLILFDHPLSPYAQKVRIALLEKEIEFDWQLPENIGSGDASGDFVIANPRAEVPALVDDKIQIFDSTIILEYIEDRWPDASPLRPTSASGRARARMIEEAMDTHFEAITWGLAEISYFGRASGALAESLQASARRDIASWYSWLEEQMDEGDWFIDDQFGWADIAVVPFLNGARSHGHEPAAGSRLGEWLERVNQRPSVVELTRTIAELSDPEGEGGNSVLESVAELLEQGLFKREYRDHRLEWMVRNGAISVVQDGLAKNNIRFTLPFNSEG